MVDVSEYQPSYREAEVTPAHPTQHFPSSSHSPLSQQPSHHSSHSSQGPKNAPVASLEVDEEYEDDEHMRVELPVTASSSQLGKAYGVGIQLYFDFGWFIALCNMVQLCVALPSFIHHLATPSTLGVNNLDVLFISSYNRDVHVTWMITSIVGIVSWFCFVPWYYFRVKRFFARRDMDDHEEQTDLRGGDDIIRENRRVSRNAQQKRVVVSWVVFTVTLVGFSVAMYFGNQVQGSDGGDLKAIVIAIALFLMKYVWKPIAGKLTHAEKHFTWSAHRKSEMIKLFLFKMGLVLTLYASKGLAEFADEKPVCILNEVGLQFFWLMITEIFVSNLIELGQPYIMTKINIRRGRQSEHGTEDARPAFDVAEEYLELLYRQFIIYLGSSVFPLITLMGLIANLLELVLDKIRLLKICKRPPFLKGSMKTILTRSLLLIAVAAVAAPPFGPVYLLTQVGRLTAHCSLFG